MYLFVLSLNVLLLFTPRSEATNQAPIATQYLSTYRRQSATTCSRPCAEQQSTSYSSAYIYVDQTAECDNSSHQARTPKTMVSVSSRASMYERVRFVSFNESVIGTSTKKDNDDFRR